MAVWEEIVDYTVPSITTQVDFTGLNITKDDFIKVVTSHAIGAGQSLHIMVNNNNTNTNYYYQALNISATSRTAERGNRPRFNRVQSNGFSTGYIKLAEDGTFNYWNDAKADVSSLSTSKIVGSSTFTMSSITQITFQGQDNAYNIGAGSRFQIYKLGAEKVADVTPASATNRFDITGLDIGKADEYLLVSDIDTSAAANFFLNANDDTTAANYRAQSIQVSGTGASINRRAEARYGTGFNDEKNLIHSHIKVTNDGIYYVQNYVIRDYGTNAVQLEDWFISSLSESLTDITELNVTSSASGAIGANSRFQLYKLY